ncbi:MAG: CvpA family protein [Synergistaceae bacterium]|jgi:membrane protein required for colicin V production|nr:CvpA family protein [Synergistaceae bacterium]
MNLTDIVLLLLGGYFIIRGVIKGFSGEAISLISVMLGSLCALKFYTPISGTLINELGLSKFVASSISMLAIFFAIFAAFAILDRGLKKALDGSSLSGVNKIFGALAGFIKIYLIAMTLLVSGMLLSPIIGDAWVRDSNVLIATAKTWPIVYPILDGAGLLPNLEDVQRDAGEYFMKQASHSLFDGGTDYGDIDALRGGVFTSADLASPIDISEDKSEGDEGGILGSILDWGRNKK